MKGWIGSDFAHDIPCFTPESKGYGLGRDKLVDVPDELVERFDRLGDEYWAACEELDKFRLAGKGAT